MPKENKQRGRRGEGKRKREANANEEPVGKRPALDVGGISFVGDTTDTFVPTPFTEETDGRPFYGLLAEEEQEYFRRADELLELNDFPSDEDRSLFLANVFKEAEGKELKIANSQSCSRLMERLILLSTPTQKKTLFQKFSGQFLHLIQHRFASHCCETLFIHSAPIVTRELTEDEPAPSDEVYVSMENSFLYTLNELDGQIGFLLNDRFASHALRVLLVVLSGKPLAKSSTKTLLQSRKKENITTPGFKSSAEELSLEARAVPSSFQDAVNKFISDTSAILDETSIPVLSCHQTANPALQLLLELELTRPTKTKDLAPEASGSILRKLLPDNIETEGSTSAAFVSGLIYESIGSRLLETLVTYAPGKLFKQIYRSTFKDRIGALARNEIATYVVIKVLERVSREDLEDAATSIIPQISSLVEYIQNTVCDKSRTDGLECQTQADALLSADSLDIDYDSDSHALTVSGLWNSPPTGGWTDQFQKPASSADQIEFGLLGADAGLEPEEIKMGGLLAVVGQDKKLKPTMFSFPSRHQHLTEPSSYTVSFAPPTGLHPTMSISMPRSSLKPPPAPSDATCALHTYLTLPSTIFGDRYQLATTDPLFVESHNLVALRALAGEMDLEAPDWVVQRWGSNWLLELATPPEAEDGASTPDPSNWTATIPLHLRYLPPSETGHRTAHIPWPVVFWACTTEDDTEMSLNPFDRKNLGWDSLFGPRTLFYQLQPAGDRLVEEIDVPVLRLEGGDSYFQGKYIELGTCVVISLGFMWVLWRLARVAWSSGVGSKRAETTHDKKE